MGSALQKAHATAHPRMAWIYWPRKPSMGSALQEAPTRQRTSAITAHSTTITSATHCIGTKKK